MSGGHYNYACTHVDLFCHEVESDLENKECNCGHEGCTTRMKRTSEIAETVSAMMRATEWYMSGDHGEETYCKLIDAAMLKLRKLTTA